MTKALIVNGGMEYVHLLSGVVDTAVCVRYTDGKILYDLDGYDLIQFTGGSDISPDLYGEIPLPTTYCNPKRDEHETSIYNSARALGIPMVGICRGLQLIHAMNGGKLHQHVGNHDCYHRVRASSSPLKPGSYVSPHVREIEFGVNSIHHQMCMENENINMDVLATSCVLDGSFMEIEAAYYPDALCFGVQFHPEYMDIDSEARKWYLYNVKALLKEV